MIDSQTGRKSVLRIPLGDENNRVDTVPQAVAAMRRLQSKREDNSLPVLRRTPKFADYAATYLDLLDRMGDRKRPATIAKERWGERSEHLGEVRLDRISRPMINDFMAKRKVAGVSNRTVNLDIILLRKKKPWQSVAVTAAKAAPAAIPSAAPACAAASDPPRRLAGDCAQRPASRRGAAARCDKPVRGGGPGR